MGRSPLHTPEEPAWLRLCRPDSSLNSRDVVALFGFKNASGLNSSVANGSFPEPDWRVSQSHGPHILDHTRFQNMWCVATIRKEIRRRLQLTKGKEE